MSVGPRTYHVEEANRLLPQVRQITGLVVEVSRQLPELQDQLRIAEYRMRRPAAKGRERDAYRRAAALPDRFLPHGKQAEILAEHGLDPEGLALAVRAALAERSRTA